jgi:hypothetical protein
MNVGEHPRMLPETGQIHGFAPTFCAIRYLLIQTIKPDHAPEGLGVRFKFSPLLPTPSLSERGRG